MTGIVQLVRAARKLLVNHDDFVNAHYGGGKCEIQAIFRNGDRLVLRPKGDMRVGDTDIFAEIFLNNSYQLCNSCFDGFRVLDIGAHIGMFTLAAIRNGARGVIAIEPEASNLELLKKNIELNRSYIIRPIGAAVTGTTGHLHVSRLNSGGHIVSASSENENRSRRCNITISADSIDRLINFERIQGLKVDCEGCEEYIFSECKSLRNLKAIFVETHDAQGNERIRRLVENKLRQWGFNIKLLQKSSSPEGNFSVLKAEKA